MPEEVIGIAGYTQAWLDDAEKYQQAIDWLRDHLDVYPRPTMLGYLSKRFDIPRGDAEQVYDDVWSTFREGVQEQTTSPSVAVGVVPKLGVRGSGTGLRCRCSKCNKVVQKMINVPCSKQTCPVCGTKMKEGVSYKEVTMDIPEKELVEDILFALVSGATPEEIIEDVLERELWVKGVKGKWKPPEGFFTKSASKVASGLKSASDSLKQAMSRLNFYINRAGKNLSPDDKKRLELAKDKLKAAYA